MIKECASCREKFDASEELCGECLEDLHADDAAQRDSIRESAKEQVRDYAALLPGWDGYDGLTFPRELIEEAIRIIDLASDRIAPTEITPCPISDGRIDLEFATAGRRLMLTLEAWRDEIEVSFSALDASKDVK